MMRKSLPIVDIGGIDTLEATPPPVPLTLMTLISLFQKVAQFLKFCIFVTEVDTRSKNVQMQRFRRARVLTDFARAQSAPALRELLPAEPEQPSELIGGRFAIERELARGGEGACFLARDATTDTVVALKRRHCNTTDELNSALAEAHMLARVSGTLSSLFPKFVGSHVQSVTEDGFRMFECYMAMEYIVGGELFRVLRDSNQNVLPIERWCRELVRAVELVHSLGFAHRDIKPENLLVRNNQVYTLVLCDFGSSAALDGERVPNVGSTFYMAPEITDIDAAALVVPSKSTDWWAAGVVMIEIASRCRLFANRTVSPGAEAKRRCLGSSSSVLDSIGWDTFVTLRYINALPCPFATTLGMLIASMLRLNPDARLTTTVRQVSPPQRRLQRRTTSTDSDSGSPTRPPVRRLSSLNESVYSGISA
jgi:serine/threonine protein kinase